MNKATQQTMFSSKSEEWETPQGLYDYLNPQSGLVSWNISIDGEGMSSDLTFSSRPPKLPKRDVFLQKLNAVSAHQLARAPASNSSHGGVGMPFNP